MFIKVIFSVLAALSLSLTVQAQEQAAGTSVSVAPVEVKKNIWNVSFMTAAGLPNMSFNKIATDSRSVQLYNLLGINYKIESDAKASFKIPFAYQTNGQDEYGTQVNSMMEILDVYLAYSKNKLGTIGVIDISGGAKVYFPTSEFSQTSKMITRLALDANFEYSLGRYTSLTYSLKPELFWQRQTAYLNTDTPLFTDGSFIKDPRATSKQYSFENYFELSLGLNKRFSVAPKIGFDEDWYYSSDVEGLAGRHTTKLVTALTFEIRPVAGLILALGAQNTTALASNKGKDVAIGQPENTVYTLMASGNLF